MVGGLPSRLVGVIAGCALVCGALVSPTTALAPASGSAAAPSTLLLEPAVSIVGERPRLSGRAPGPARRLVRLQARRYDGTWRTIDRRRTRADRTFGFRLAPVRLSSVVLRVLSPRTGQADPWRSAPTTVRGVPHQVDLTVPTEAFADDPVLATVSVTPARPGRPVHLLLGENVVDTGVQDGAGQAVLTLVPPAPGAATVRATVPAVRGAVDGTSPPVPLQVLPGAAAVPRVDVVTDDGLPVTSKSSYKRAVLTVDPRDSGITGFTDSVRLRVRGNFTSGVAEKRPYKLKLDDDVPLAGMPESEDWVLLANYFDRSLLRNTLGMEVGRRLQHPWSPRLVDVELWLNGEPKGLYQLGEGIEVQPGRLDIELEDNDATNGGYTLEADKNVEDDPSFITSRDLQIYVKEPGVDQAYADQVAAYVQEAEDVLYSPGFADPTTGYRAYLDVPSFVDWYLAMELMKTYDAGFNNSIHLYREVGGLLAMGPLWDFDLSSGNRRQWHVDDPEGWFIRTNWFGTPENEVLFPASQMNHAEGHWIVRLFEDPAFEQQVRERWAEVRASLLTLPEFVESRRVLIAAAAYRNFEPVESGGAGHPLGPSPYDDATVAVFHGSHAASAQALRDWLAARLAWMDAELS